jgi:hypothetical protein
MPAVFITESSVRVNFSLTNSTHFRASRQGVGTTAPALTPAKGDNNGYRVELSQAYDQYVAWCSAAKFQPTSAIQFTRDVRDIADNLSIQVIDENGVVYFNRVALVT